MYENGKGTHHALIRMRTSPSARVGSGFLRALTLFNPPKPLSTIARMSFGSGVGFSSPFSLGLSPSPFSSTFFSSSLVSFGSSFSCFDGAAASCGIFSPSAFGLVSFFSSAIFFFNFLRIALLNFFLFDS